MITLSYLAVSIKGTQITKERRTLVATNKLTALKELTSWNKHLQPLNNFTLYLPTYRSQASPLL